MKVNSIRGTKTERILQDVKIALWGALTLILALVTVMEAFFAGSDAIGVEEPLSVSSALISKGGTKYTSSVTGILVNNGEAPITVDRLSITVKGGKREEVVTLDTPMLILPRNTERIYYTWESHTAYDSVRGVEVTVGGKTQSLYNLPEQGSSFPVVISLALAALSGWLLSRAIRVRLYMHEESKLPSDM